MRPPPQKEGGEANRPAADVRKNNALDTDTASPTSPQARWKAANPQAVWAQHALRSAIRRGLVHPKPCEQCGEEKAEGHHPDYSRPADVVWLCRRCHKAAHRKQRRAA